MTSFKQTLFVFILLFIAQFSFGQVTLYNEDFAGQVGKGVIGPVAYTYDTVGMTWVIDASACDLVNANDWFNVNASEQFEAKDLDGEAIWQSPSIDISSLASVNLSVDLVEIGTLESTDFINAYYILDGGSQTLFSVNGSNADDFGSLTATQDSLIGSTITIVITLINNVGNEFYTFDNLSVIENISNVQNLYDLPESTSINLHWSNPASDFDEILVVANQGSALTAGQPTGDGTLYTANTTLGSGTSLLGGTVLYKGAGTTTNFTGVTSGNSYYVKVFTRKGTTWSTGYERTIAFAPPGVGDVLITEYARHATISDYSYIELYNTTSSDISLAGAKMIVNNAGSLSQVVDLSTDISGNITVPANGFLILNRNRSQASFETTWGVTLGASVNYNRTAINNFGNDKLFVLKMGGTEGADDGTIIDESTEFTGGTGNRVFQLPKGYWAGNIDDAATYATPGSFYAFENINNIQMAYSDGAWHAETGYAYTEPSASTGSTAAVIVRGNATITDGSVLNVLGIWPDAGTSITTETITINTGLYLANNASLAITSTGAVSCAGEISITRNGYNLATDYNAWGTPFSTSLPVDSIFTDHNPCDFYVFKATDQSWKHDYTIGSSVTCTGNTSTIIAANVIESPEGTPDGNFDIARGYFIVGNTSNEYDFRIASGGTLNNGSITANIYGSSAGEISGSNDWNLISNPYPSALDADLFLTTNSSIIENALYLYNPGNGIDSTVSYTTINNTDGAHIASCQGFFVNANTATDGLIGTVSFINSMRTNQNDNFRSFDSFSGVYLNVTNEKNTTDQTRLYFDRDCEDGRDRKFDAVKMENSGFNFGSKLGDDIMVFNGLKELTTQTKVIPLYFQTTQKSVYSISLDSLLGDMNNKDILLEDRFMRKFHDLRGQDYSFLSDAKEWKNRFFIHIVEQKRNNGSGTGPITGVDEVNRNEVKVFQTGEEIIISSNIEELNQVELMTINGKRISSYNVNGNTHSINITSLTIGIYLVRYQLNNGAVETQKIVIQ